MFVPETVIPALHELIEAFGRLKDDPSFVAELDHYLQRIAGGLHLCSFAERLTAECGGARIYLKRRPKPCGAHKINNAIGQMLIARRLGKSW